jgi:hypothetical protein
MKEGLQQFTAIHSSFLPRRTLPFWLLHEKVAAPKINWLTRGSFTERLVLPAPSNQFLHNEIAGSWDTWSFYHGSIGLKTHPPLTRDRGEGLTPLYHVPL